eukprot:m.101264 g.101264  ORF g.101264 m.101264 type:complete len:330 (-) comp27318_c2_seq1:215-1204(-)
MGASLTRNFSCSEIPNLKGRVFFVTGGNAGLGFETAKQLVSVSATVIVTTRQGKTEETAAKLAPHVADGGRLETLCMDLGDLASVRSAVAQFTALKLPLHVLVNNAGVMMCPHGSTTDGFETQFGVNHLGHFLLTSELFPFLSASSTSDQPSRVVTLSSSMHEKGPREGILFDNLTWDSTKPGPTYTPELAYGHSKFANLVFSKELQKRATAAAIVAGDESAAVVCNAVHPGFVDTALTRHKEAEVGTWMVWVYKKAKGALPVQDGALTQLFCAASPQATAGGKFYIPIAVESEVFKDCPTITAALSTKLWEVSEKLVGATFTCVANKQ